MKKNKFNEKYFCTFQAKLMESHPWLAPSTSASLAGNLITQINLKCLYFQLTVREIDQLM